MNRIRKISIGHTLSLGILLLLFFRPVLNQFQGDDFGSMGGYSISLLSLWSALLLILLLARMPFAPYLDSRVKNSGLLLLLYLSFVGLPQLSRYGNFAANYLYIVMIVMVMMNAHKIIHDLGMERIVNVLAWSAVLLAIMHGTGFLWAKKHLVISDDVGGYIGAFANKHIAAGSFIVLVPYTFLKYYRTRSRFWLTIFLLNCVFLVMSLQRVSMLSLLLGVTFLVFMLNKKRYLVYALMAASISLMFVPEQYYDEFLQEKVIAEMNEYESGDFVHLGAGRGGLVIDAARIYFEKMNLFEELFGKGLGYSDLVHLQVVGHLTYVHLQFLQLFVDLGLAGVIIYAVFLYQLLRAKIRIHRAQPDMISLLGLAYAFVFCCQMFYDMPFQNGGTFTLLALLAYSPSARWRSGMTTEWFRNRWPRVAARRKTAFGPGWSMTKARGGFR